MELLTFSISCGNLLCRQETGHNQYWLTVVPVLPVLTSNACHRKSAEEPLSGAATARDKKAEGKPPFFLLTKLIMDVPDFNAYDPSLAFPAGSLFSRSPARERCLAPILAPADGKHAARFIWDLNNATKLTKVRENEESASRRRPSHLPAKRLSHAVSKVAAWRAKRPPGFSLFFPQLQGFRRSRHYTGRSQGAGPQKVPVYTEKSTCPFALSCGQ